MSKTYRALAIVAVVAPLVSIGSLLLSTYISNLSISGVIPPTPPGGERWIPAIELPVWWAPALSSLAAPVIATFAATVAAQSRRWGWLVAFIALGAFGVIGLTLFITPLPFLAAPFDNASPEGIYGLNAIVAGYSPMILLALVALLFVLLPHDKAAPAQIKPGALAIIVVVATLVSLVSIVWSTHNAYAASGSSFNAIGLPILNVGLAGINQTTQVIVDITSLWDPVTNGLAAPIVATLAILVAAQARRWGWVVAFSALSILCALGPAIIPELELRNIVQVNSSTIVVLGVGFYQALPMLLLVIAALVFALWRPRAAPAAASAAIAPQAG
ncbi:MAG TPA: hypothetical protein VHI51_13105 [Ktedonobacterales bacterium]|nr:hypothetical protein [Ktedonobacterales bacterium]